MNKRDNSEGLGSKKLFNKDIVKALVIKDDNFIKQNARGTIEYPEIMSFLLVRSLITYSPH